MSADPFEMEWDQETVPLEAVDRALYSLADRISGTVTAAGSSWRVAVHPRSDLADPIELAHQLRISVNDHALRCRIAAETDPLRNLIFALAFSRSGLIEADADR